MNKQNILEIFIDNPIIAAVSNIEKLDRAIE